MTNQKTGLRLDSVLLTLLLVTGLHAEDLKVTTDSNAEKRIPAFYTDLTHADLYFEHEPHHLIMDRGVVTHRTDGEIRIKTVFGDALKLKGTLLDSINVGESVDAIWLNGNVISIRPTGLQIPVEFRQTYHVDIDFLRGLKKEKANCDSGTIVSTGDKFLIFKRRDGNMIQIPMSAEIRWDESKGHILRTDVKPSMSIFVMNFDGRYRISVSDHALHAATAATNPQNDPPLNKQDGSGDRLPKSF